MTAVPAGDAWQAWELFGDAILTGLLLSFVLPMLGVLLVLRHQVFLAASIGQAASFGIAVAIYAGLGAAEGQGHAHTEGLALAFGLLFAMATAVLSMRALSARSSALEARPVWIFLLAGSGAMVLLAHAPHGLQEVQRLFLSSLLGASPQDVWIAAAFVAIAGASALRARRALLLWALDPPSAQAYGAPVCLIDVLVGGFVGAALGFAIHATGLLFTFGCTVLPVLFVREVASSLTAVLWSAPAVGAVCYAAGFVLADRADLPPGQTTVVLGGLLVAIGGAYRLLRTPR